ncbi:AAA family ATPase [Salmonella enterica subsp. enterica serovar Oranienburg]|uniref:AAA family ATPase n=1 Tax=Salmonella enterica TaxID=28901 RepID=UPI000710BA67|nr:AAA family ATPase [Salmonella enterica]EAA8037221.1 AAA family ATPase [Salmonella enterica subsp. enterica serovar Duisburg]EBR8190237.1 AAA family ATPase [Salmonella enterica subsp. enterica serovar Oranienburg]EBS2193495.1 AAA family ATPase [Salmonella enterica subsp. enterica serovar Thompson]EDN0386042.1 transcriptional regulator [Salmonella enterica subsp. enterica serovar Newport]EEU8020012.1 AAA family ATPase [Salmonella enterica subsp. enterica serovar Montevideo]OIN26028.1 transcr
MTDINEVINTINDLIARDVFTQATIAKEMGVADATLSAFRNGKYTGDNERLTAKLQDWYDNYQQQVTLPEAPQFVVTETVQELQALFLSARLMRCINVVVGEPGVGKTAAARDYCSKANTWMVTLSPAHSSVTECLQELAVAIGLGEIKGGKGPLSRAIRKALAGKKGLVIIDEADHLNIEGFEQMRAIQDATGVGMVLIGNPEGMSDITGRRNDSLTRLASRMARTCKLNSVLDADVEAIADAWGIKGREELAEMKSIARKPGALRILTNVLNQAWIAATGERSPLRKKHIKAAYKENYGETLKGR